MSNYSKLTSIFNELCDKSADIAELKQLWNSKEVKKRIESINVVKKAKDPNKPKRARTSYNFFCQSLRPQLKQEDVGYKDMMAVLGERWKVVEDKTEYEQLAVKDKERYDNEMNQYNPPEQKVKPKRARTSYNFFCQLMRPQLKQEGVGYKDMMAVLGERWKVVEDKTEYEQLAVKDKERYDNEMSELQ